MKNMGGRPRKLTQEIKDVIVEGVGKGLTLKAACKCAGISYSSLGNWKKFAKNSDDEATFYRDLFVRVNAAIIYAQYQHRQEALASIKNEDFKYRKPPKVKMTRKEKEDQSVNNTIERIRKSIAAYEKGVRNISGGI